jgi:hypothetical protein
MQEAIHHARPYSGNTKREFTINEKSYIICKELKKSLTTKYIFGQTWVKTGGY